MAFPAQAQVRCFVQGQATGDGDAMPALLAADLQVRQAHLFEGAHRKLVVGAFDFLQQQDVGGALGHIAGDLIDAQANRVDVPGGQAKGHAPAIAGVGKVAQKTPPKKARPPKNARPPKKRPAKGQAGRFQGLSAEGRGMTSATVKWLLPACCHYATSNRKRQTGNRGGARCDRPDTIRRPGVSVNDCGLGGGSGRAAGTGCSTDCRRV